jgi:hypothetical protein
MIKQILILASMAVVVLACRKEEEKEEETDFEKGKKDGVACCSCMETATTDEQKSLCLLQHLDLNKFAELSVTLQLNDYTAGLLTAPCVWREFMNGGEYSDMDDFLPEE